MLSFSAVAMPEEVPVPPLVAAALARSRQMGFPMSCDPVVGRLLAVLAAHLPEGARVLELGTGAGVGTSIGAAGTSAAAGAATVFSPPKGFWYSRCGVISSRAVGWYSPAGAAGAADAAGAEERLPRARPEPRLAPNVPKEPASGWAAGVSFVAAESPDGTWSVIGSFFLCSGRTESTVAARFM